VNESVGQLLSRACQLQRENRKAIACLLVKARGSTPQSAGALMLVDDASNTYGTIGGGCVEAEIRRSALELIDTQASALLRFKLDHDYGWDDGLICGGTIEMAIAPFPSMDQLERVIHDLALRRATSIDFHVHTDGHAATFTLELPPRDRLYIAGAGHVGQAVARLAQRLEFEVTLLDDRADLLAKFAPQGCTIVSGEIADQLKSLPCDDRTSIIIVTRGHKHDEQALAASIDRGAAYVGMIGSRRKVKLTFDDLTAIGIAPASLQAVHAPIGLDIGAITVEEIAVSIIAELIQVRRQRQGSPVIHHAGAEACATSPASP
jgi:xanthine dehydrogenase accessory factor